MGRIADALAQVVGNVLVTGHTDNQPIARSARFPSNWHLSDERARNVRDLLVAHKVAPDRIRAEGRADAEPVVPNDTASQPGAQPARRGDALRRPPLRGEREPAARQMIAKLLGLVFNRWVLLAVLLLAVSLVVWIAGPLIGLTDRAGSRGSRSSPSRRAGSRSRRSRR